MTLIEQLLCGALAAILAVGLVGGIVEWKQKAEEQVEEIESQYEDYLNIIDGGDVPYETK